MTGHVFHPGHEDLHGITVLISGVSGRAYVGRYHEKGPTGVVLHDVAVHEPESTLSRRDWLARQHRFGVEARHRHLVVPIAELAELVRFADTRE